ncbi:hypothetical protein [Sinomonas mesophila]|uniref:hypothetical protein n=1 Tax=Sinomonas mesophila TaxID=1531955 RepID=UPI00158A8D94|nr:hypothetical protein [Sinomonas mesophila]
MGQEDGSALQQLVDAAREIEQLAQGVRGRVNGLESRRDLEKIIRLARDIEKGMASA